MKFSTIEVEKFERNPGIYIIFNKNTKKVYIGKANDLKRRMEEHVRYLFAGGDNNKKLQDEFNEGGNKYSIRLLKEVQGEVLDDYESIFFRAAECIYGRTQVYNEKALYKVDENDERIPEACEIINETINKKNVIVHKFKTLNGVLGRIQDFIVKSKEEIEKEAIQRKQKLIKENGENRENRGQEELALKGESIRELYEKGRLDYILLGTVGDYVGSEKPQTITDILSEKIADIAYYGKCLWAGAGPSVEVFHEFREKYGFGEEKKLYVLFSLTISKYNKEAQKYVWKDKDGMIYSDTAPKKSTYRFKALVIDRLWTVKEDFEIDSFYDLYYRYEKRYTGQGEHILNNNVSECVRQMQMVVSKKAILKNKNLQKDLEMEGEFLKKFSEEKIPCQNKSLKFPSYSNEEHPVYYLLAEVSDYVWMEEESSIEGKQ